MEVETVLYRDLATIDYAGCWALQEAIFEGLTASKGNRYGKPEDALKVGAAGAKRENPEQPEDRQYAAEPAASNPAACPTLILCEHPHVYTLGKSGKAGNLLVDEAFLQRIGASYYHIDRGGDITYHGPGQLVGYPLLDLERLGMGLKEYIHALEQTVIDTVAEYGIRAGRVEGAAGVWLPADSRGGLRKICAIGVRSSHYVTMHGFALNVNTRLEYFSYINPCGFTDRGVTSMEKELGRSMEMAEVKRCYLSHFKKNMNVKIKIEPLCQQQKDGYSSPRVIPRK